MMKDSRPMLRVENLCKSFILHNLGGKHVDAFRNVSFGLETGQCLGVTGPSGAGKSSLLKCIYRTYRPTSGLILCRHNGGWVDLTAASDRIVLEVRETTVAYVSQFLRVIPRVSAWEVVAEPLFRRGCSPAEAYHEAEKLLHRLRIPEHLFQAFPAHFSGGEQQRINIARALIGRPRLLLLDEPTSALDQEAKEGVISLLQELKSSGTTMIGVFHDLTVLNRICDEVIHLEP
jgi:alpha-D-ribose 1-methylphosphonate 5-triphosphate synthase subunit PhnL